MDGLRRDITEDQALTAASEQDEINAEEHTASVEERELIVTRREHAADARERLADERELRLNDFESRLNARARTPGSTTGRDDRDPAVASAGSEPALESEAHRLRQQFLANAADLARTEEHLAQIHEQLGVTQAQRRPRHVAIAQQAREVARHLRELVAAGHPIPSPAEADKVGPAQHRLPDR